MQISLLDEDFALFKSIMKTVVSLYMYTNRASLPTHFTAGRMSDEKLLNILEKGFMDIFIVVQKTLLITEHQRTFSSRAQTKSSSLMGPDSVHYLHPGFNG